MVMAVWKYPEDLTGQNPNNLVAREVHTLPLSRTRAFATNYGPHYSDSVRVWVVSSNQELVRGVGFECLYLYGEATYATGLPVTAVIHILDSTVDGDVEVDYQVVGGPYSSNAYALEELFGLLEIDNRAVSWENVINKPATFPPEPHLHPATDLYGFEYLVDAINDQTQAILLGDTASHDQIYLRINTLKLYLENLLKALEVKVNQNTLDIAAVNQNLNTAVTNLTSAINLVAQNLTNHMNDKTNSHQVTAAQVNLGNVLNARMANDTEHIAGTNSGLYSNPRGIRLFHESLRGFSTAAAPGSSSGYPEGYIWYQVK